MGYLPGPDHFRKVPRLVLALIGLLLLIFCLSGFAYAGGSLAYSELREKFPDDGVLFDTLESALDFNESAFAIIRIMWGQSEEFSGMRLGPYYVCARQKYGDQRHVLVVFETEVDFYDKDGKTGDILDKDVARIRETLSGVRIVDGDSPEGVEYGCGADKPDSSQ